MPAPSCRNTAAGSRPGRSARTARRAAVSTRRSGRLQVRPQQPRSPPLRAETRDELPAPDTRQEASWSAIRPGPASAVSALPPAARSSRRWPGPEQRRPRQWAALPIAPGGSRSGVPRRTRAYQTWSSVPEPGWSREWRWASWLGQGEFGSGVLPAGTRPAPIPPMVKQSVILARVRPVYSLDAAIAVLSSPASDRSAAQKDIAIHVGCGQATVSRRFGSIYQLAQSQSRISLRGPLFLLANSGCSPIALPKSRKPLRDMLLEWHFWTKFESLVCGSHRLLQEID